MAIEIDLDETLIYDSDYDPEYLPGKPTF